MDDFGALTKSIEAILAIQCANYKEDYIKRRISSRMRLTGKEDFRSYLEFFKDNQAEQESLRNALTINVTKFWRDREVFDIIHKEILPDLIKRKDRIRIWSAGCATGEEPYTLALMAHDMTRLRPNVQITIYATDIDQEALRKAKNGIYDKRVLENLTESQIRRHFSQKDDGKYEVRAHLKEYIRFSQHDLMSGKAVTGNLDIILCRNVTIYFTEAQKNELARTFHPALVSGGYYVLGKTEFLGRDVEKLYVPYNSLQKIYRKNDGMQHRSAITARIPARG
ncbi:MAG: protein-glutamate O-methyltransferase CheR [Methanomicrobiales archaeon]|nr:protein-glutamate O-methyltransferase CheR [Methanomicrobiales archaeon]